MAIYSIPERVGLKPEWVEHAPVEDDPWRVGTYRWTLDFEGEEVAVITACFFYLEAKATNHKGQVRVGKFSHLSDAKRWAEQVVFSHRGR